MAKDENNESKAAAMAAALEKANKEAGYDVPLAFAAINAAVINEQTTYDFEMFKAKIDIAAIADMVVRGRGNRIDSDTLATLMETAMAYGWHWAMENDSLVRSEKVKAEIADFIDAKPELTVTEKVERKKGLDMGFAAMKAAVEKMEARMKIVKAVKK